MIAAKKVAFAEDETFADKMERDCDSDNMQCRKYQFDHFMT